MYSCVPQRRGLKHHRKEIQMNELQKLLGDAYKEGMTIEEINAALQGKKFADLSTGNYVDKNKYDADIKAKTDELNQKAQELASKMTDDEKAKADVAAKDKLIATLQQKIKEDAINSSKTNATAILAANKKLLGIKDDDTSYDDFIASISSENFETTKTIATYINKLVTDSYEKGKKDSGKDSLGNFAKGVSTSSSAQGNDVGKLGTELAKASNGSVDSNLYFKSE